MVKKPTGGKETIIPPATKNLKEASKGLKKGDGPSGRTMSDASVAKKEGVKRPSGKK